jgi:membrane-associated phospholipid phosphatase
MDASATRGRAVALAVAALLALAGAAVYLAAAHTGAGHWVDEQAGFGLRRLSDAPVATPAEGLVRLFDPLPFALLTAAVGLVALLRGRVRAAVVVPAAMVAANVTAQALQRVLETAPSVSGVAYPSGHTTAAASVALGLVLVLPARLRPPAAAAGGVVVALAGFALVLVGWHLPSDVAGGLLLTGAWLAMALAALSPEPAERDAGPAAGQILLAAAPAAALVAAVVGALLLAEPEDALSGGRAVAFVVAGGALGATALALPAAFAVLAGERRA